MSLQTTSYVLKRLYGNQIRKLLMIAIADYTGDDTGTAWAYIDTLAHRAECSRRSVQGHLDILEAEGELEIYRNAGPGGSHRFRVLFRNPDEGETAPRRGANPARGVQMGGAQTAKGGANDGTPVAPKTILTVSKLEEGEERAAPDAPPSPILGGDLDAAVAAELRATYPSAPRLVGRDLAAWTEALPLLRDLEAEDWEAHRAWNAAPNRIRGKKLWPRDRGEFLANAGQTVELYRKWWKRDGRDWWREKPKEVRALAIATPDDGPPLSIEERLALAAMLHKV